MTKLKPIKITKRTRYKIKNQKFIDKLFEEMPEEITFYCQETEFNACTEFYGIDTSIESFKDMKNEPYWEFIEDELPKEVLNPEDWTEI